MNRPFGKPKRFIQRFGTASILVCVALHQLYLVYSDDLTPWKGAGFGMFSSVDAGGNRRLSITVHSAGMSYTAYADDSLIVLAKRLPSNSILEALARNLADMTWIATDGPQSWSHSLAADSAPYRYLASRSFSAVESLFEDDLAKPNASSEGAHTSAHALPRVRAWIQSRRVPDSIVVAERVAVAVYREVFDPETVAVRLELINTAMAEGISAQEIERRHGTRLRFVGKHR